MDRVVVVDVLSPTGPSVGRELELSSEWVVDLRGARVGFLSNGKPKSEELLVALERRIQERYGISESVWANKTRDCLGPGVGASEEVLGRLTTGVVAVLAASGD